MISGAVIFDFTIGVRGVNLNFCNRFNLSPSQAILITPEVRSLVFISVLIVESIQIKNLLFGLLLDLNFFFLLLLAL